MQDKSSIKEKRKHINANLRSFQNQDFGIRDTRATVSLFNIVMRQFIYQSLCKQKKYTYLLSIRFLVCVSDEG